MGYAINFVYPDDKLVLGIETLEVALEEVERLKKRAWVRPWEKTESPIKNLRSDVWINYVNKQLDDGIVQIPVLLFVTEE